MFRTFKAAVENESNNKLREFMTDNARELSMGEMRTICDDGIKLSITVYHPASNGITKRATGVITSATRAVLRNGLWGKARCRPLAHIRPPCAIVEAKEQLKKLDNHVTMHFFVGYKYERGGYRVWGPKRRVIDVAEVLFLVGGSRRKYAEAPLGILSWHFACVRSVGIGAVVGMLHEVCHSIRDQFRGEA